MSDRYRDLLVREALRDLVHGVVGERHSGELGLNAVDQMTEDPAPAVQALTELRRTAIAATAACRDAGEQDLVPLGDGLHAGSRLDDSPDGFVAEDPPGGHLRNVALEDV